MSQDREHDDHCRILFDGVAWKIGQILDQGRLMCLWHGPGAIDQEFATIDVSGVDWVSYCTRAALMLEDGGFPVPSTNPGDRRPLQIDLPSHPDVVMYSAEMPPFKLTVFYLETWSQFRVVVRHADGRERSRTVPAVYEPRSGIDADDQIVINQAAEAMCREIERNG